MNFFKRRKQQPHSAPRAIFDIRPRSVSVALVRASGGHLEVLWSKRRAVRQEEHDHGDLHRRAVCRTLEALLEDMETGGRTSLRTTCGDDKIEAMSFVLASPWSRDQIVSSRMSQPRQFLLNRDHIYTAGRLAYNDFSRGDEEDLLPLSQRITSLYGDGQSIRFPYEYPIRELELYMHVSKLPRTIKEMIEAVVSKHYHPDKLSFHSSADAVNRVLTRAFEHPTDFLVVIPEHTQTDIILVEDGQMKAVKSLPIGEDFLLEAMSQAFGRPTADVRSRLNLHHRGKMSPVSQEIAVALEEVGSRWQELFKAAVSEMRSDNPPAYAYLLVEDREHKPAFEDFFSAATQTLSGMQTYVIDNDLFTDHFLVNGGINCTLAVSVLGVEMY